MNARVCLVATLALAGCHSSGQPADGGSGCSGSLSGAISETILGCKVTWAEQGGVADVGNDGNIGVSDPSQIVDFTRFGFVLTVDGDARTGTFSMANVSKLAAGVNVQSDGGVDSYIANFSAVSGGPPSLGSLSAEITRFTFDFVNGPTTQWIVHGTMTANLVPAPGATGSGSVQMSIVF